SNKQTAKEVSSTEIISPKNTETKRRLSFKEKREFELIEKDLAELSKEKETINAKLNSGQLPYDELQKLSQRIIDVS
ncbi:ABC transporter C-terminal domain-containing protein, partial [Rhizobium leguminosarum]|uniref:ABC transporter C-terminal domain-containing protein n=1 Tax=Rhizobium leguminosarum TaxID=384 RepID=UPI003F9D15FD